MKTTATIAEIAAALNLKVQSIYKRAKGWQPIDGSYPTRYDIDTLQLRTGEVKKIKAFLARSACKIIPIHAIDKAAEQTEKERQRREARAQGLELFNRLPAWQRQGADAKLTIIRACINYIRISGLHKKTGQDAFAHEYNLGRIEVAPVVRDEIPQLHPGTLRNWITAEVDQGMMGLVDMYGNRKGQSKINTHPVYAEALKAVLTREPHIEPKKACEYMLGCVPDGPEVSIKSVGRWMDAYKKEHAEEWATIVNPDRAKGNYRFSVGSADANINGPNQRWEIDVTPADLLLSDGQRWKIIGMIDVGVRRLKLLVKKTEKAIDNLDLVRRCLLDWGMPRGGVLYCDNGSAYQSNQFKAFANDIEMELHFCKPFASEEKPFIERAFHTVSHDMLEHLPGYCGHNVADRKDIESRKSFAKRLKDKDELIEIGISSIELQAALDRWLAVYHETVHSSLGMTPNLALAQSRHTIYKIQDERALDVLLAPIAGKNGTRVISKGSFMVDNFEYTHHLFALHAGETVFCRQTDDMGKIIVEVDNEMGGRDFLCIAECPEITGLSRAEVTKHGQALQKQLQAASRAEIKRLAKEFAGRSTFDTVMSFREKQIAEKNNITYLPKREVEYTSAGLQAAGAAAAALAGEIKRTVTPALTPDQQAYKERLQREMAEAEAKKVRSIAIESPRKRYEYFTSMRKQLSEGGELPPVEEYAALEQYEKGNEFRVLKSMEQDAQKALQ